MQLEKCKSPICFSPVLPKSPSEVIIGQRLKDRALEEISGPCAYKEKSHIFERPQKWSYIHNPQ